MATTFDYTRNDDIAWCPGCGNFNILKTIKETLEKEKISPDKLTMVSGIGQAAKIPQYMNTNYFNGLHGRALPAATAIKAANPELVVIAESGDGDMYGEGGNHFMHTIRRNPDITNIVHNNMVYGLTKGQASPTSQRGFVTPVQVDGVILDPANPLIVAIAYGATFVARGYSGDKEQLAQLISEAIHHKGYALVEVLHPCVTFNKVNNHKWYKENTYTLDNRHNRTSKLNAIDKLIDQEKLAMGIIYREDGKSTFEENIAAYKKNKDPLFKRNPNLNKLQKIIDSY